MQKFRNNLITPELASKLILKSVNFYNLRIDNGRSREDERYYKKSSKRFFRETKKISSLIESILEIEFQGYHENCIWDDINLKFDIHANEENVLFVNFEISVLCQSLFEEEQDDNCFIGVLTGHKIAFSIASFLKSMSNNNLQASLAHDHYEIKLHHYFFNDEDFDFHGLILENASLEVKKS